MKIALDYDDTFTKDKGLWRWFVQDAQSRGHSVTFVTFRCGDRDEWNNRDIDADATSLAIPIVFSQGKPKSDVFKADIWIDDMPELIKPCSPFTPLFVSEDGS